MEKNTKTIDSLTKFCACFGIEKSFLMNRMKDEAFLISKLGERFEAWKKFMYKNDLEEYIFMLISLLYHEHIPKEVEEIQTEYVDLLDSYTILLETLNFMISDDIVEIVIQKKSSCLKVNDKFVVEAIIEGIYNQSEFIKPDIDSIRNSFDKIYNDIATEDQRKEIWDYINEYLVYPAEECENDPYFTETRRGAKKKNEIAFIIGKQLSFLVRLERFLTNKEGITDIENIPLKNKDCIFIHDCLVAFREIESQTNREFTTTTPEKYIRTLLKQTVPYKVNIPTATINQLKSEIN